MSNEDAVSDVALVVALVALVVSGAQLLQAIFGTAEGFRRTNRQIMGPFSQTRDRVFHITELRYETTFRTPHFKFKRATITRSENESSPSEGKQTSQDSSASEHTGSKHSNHKDVKKPFGYRYIQTYEDEEKEFQDLIKEVGRVSRLQRVLRWVDSNFRKFRDHRFIEEHSKAFAASWLLLLDQLFEREKRVYQERLPADRKEYWHERLAFPPGAAQPVSTEPGPDREGKQWHRLAIELEQRSWDLMPPDIVRPLASIDMGDFLTLCFRLRIEIHPEERSWSADGEGHSFSPLRVQGLGTVVQYRFDPLVSPVEEKYPANGYFAPSEACDKLAFGIIPANPDLGINREWKVNTAPNFTDSIMTHFEELGVSEETRRLMKDDKSEDKHNTSEALCESLLLLCPPLVVDGLGIIKYVPPYPRRWAESMLQYREFDIVFRNRLNEMYPGLVEKEKRMRMNHMDRPGPTNLRESQIPPTRETLPGSSGEKYEDRIEWVGAVMNFFEQTQHELFFDVPSLHTKFAKNAQGAEAKELLRRLRTALAEADKYLQDKFGGVEGAYEALVAAHVEMALIHHTNIKQEERKPERDRFPFRDGTGVRGVWPRKTETAHCYIDSATAPEDAKTNVTVVGLFRKHYSKKSRDPPTDFRTEDIREGWFTMMLRAILWGYIHLPIYRAWLPYKSKYYGDSKLVMIA